jgi:hypothetical protein
MQQITESAADGEKQGADDGQRSSDASHGFTCCDCDSGAGGNGRRSRAWSWTSPGDGVSPAALDAHKKDKLSDQLKFFFQQTAPGPDL